MRNRMVLGKHLLLSWLRDAGYRRCPRCRFIKCIEYFTPSVHECKDCAAMRQRLRNPTLLEYERQRRAAQAQRRAEARAKAEAIKLANRERMRLAREAKALAPKPLDEEDRKALQIWSKHEDPHYYQGLRYAGGSTRYWSEV